jgi:hypothetical protein
MSLLKKSRPFRMLAIICAAICVFAITPRTASASASIDSQVRKVFDFLCAEKQIRSYGRAIKTKTYENEDMGGWYVENTYPGVRIKFASPTKAVEPGKSNALFADIKKRGFRLPCKVNLGMTRAQVENALGNMDPLLQNGELKKAYNVNGIAFRKAFCYANMHKTEDGNAYYDFEIDVVYDDNWVVKEILFISTAG